MDFFIIIFACFFIFAPFLLNIASDGEAYREAKLEFDEFDYKLELQKTIEFVNKHFRTWFKPIAYVGMAIGFGLASLVILMLSGYFWMYILKVPFKLILLIMRPIIKVIKFAVLKEEE